MLVFTNCLSTDCPYLINWQALSCEAVCLAGFFAVSGGLVAGSYGLTRGQRCVNGFGSVLCGGASVDCSAMLCFRVSRSLRMAWLFGCGVSACVTMYLSIWTLTVTVAVPPRSFPPKKNPFSGNARRSRLF